MQNSVFIAVLSDFDAKLGRLIHPVQWVFVDFEGSLNISVSVSIGDGCPLSALR